MVKFLKNLEKNNYSINTLKSYKSILQQYEKFWTDIRLIKKKIINYFNSPNTAWTHYNVLISYMKWNKDKRFLKLKELKIPKIPKKYMPIFSKNFLLKKTELNNIDNSIIQKKKTVVKFLFETGIRASELKQIISISKDTIVLKGKGWKIREIFHNYQTTKLLKPFEYTTKTLRLWVKEILGKKYTPHSIRRSHATHMLLKGANPKAVMLQLGHEKIETTFQYLQLSKKANKQIYKKYF